MIDRLVGKRGGMGLGALLAACVMAGCATAYMPPTGKPVAAEFQIPVPFDRVWEATIDQLAKWNMTITTLEKASGIVAFKAGDYPAEFADEGTLRYGQIVVRRTASFNVFVRAVSPASVTWRVNVDYVPTDNEGHQLPAISSGVFEVAFYRRVVASLGITPDTARIAELGMSRVREGVSPKAGGSSVLVGGVAGAVFPARLSEGVAVDSVLDAGSGLEIGDVIVEVAGRAVSTRDDVSSGIGYHKTGESITVKIRRRGVAITTRAVLH